ncbi:MAG: GDSL-type esterase/lipase family protein [Kiritimatiellia bacterium]
MRFYTLLLATIGFSCLLQAAPLKVACIGDSITFGTGLQNRAQDAYPVQLQKLLGATYEVRNFGNAGRGIYLHSWRGNQRRGYRYMAEHQAALQWKPDIVICNLGINDNGEFLQQERHKPGSFRDDYITLLKDYAALSSHPQLWVWGKLAPLAPRQKFYRSPEAFLMQTAIAQAAQAVQAKTIDMQQPLREVFTTHLPDAIHPDVEATRLIAQATAEALLQKAEPPVTLPKEIAHTAEVWLCAGQSNMLFTLKEGLHAKEEAAATRNCNIHVWDYRTGQWIKATPQNAGNLSSVALSFAIRRAQTVHKPIALLMVCQGGTPTESFLSEPTLAAVDATGTPRYPTLLKTVTNRRPIDVNEDFLPVWCAKEYRRRLNAESAAWATSYLYDHGIAKIKQLPLTGILWYQGESNATRNISPDTPLPTPYLEETLRAVISELRPTADTPFLMVGLPKMNRPWEPYRAAQKKVCEESGAIYLDTFGADLGELNNVHPRNKVPIAEMAADAAQKALAKQSTRTPTFSRPRQ